MSAKLLGFEGRDGEIFKPYCDLMHGILATLALFGPQSWTFVVGGDIMTNGISGSTNPFTAIAPIVRKADLAYANLEIPLTTANTRTPRKTPAELARHAQFILKGDPAHAPQIKAAGFDFVSLANNHAMDYRSHGLSQMLKLLNKNGIGHAGAGANLDGALRPAIVNVNGLKVGLISFLGFQNNGSLVKCTPAKPKSMGIAVLMNGGKIDSAARKRIADYVAAARGKCDLLFVALHWGIERTTVPIRYQVDMARAFIDSGADGVIGAHPHVLQGTEVYHGKPIFYSLGNLCSPLPASTALFRMTYDGKKFVSMQPIPCRISGGRVTPLTGGGAASELRRIAGLNQAVKRTYPQSVAQK